MKIKVLLHSESVVELNADPELPQELMGVDSGVAWLSSGWHLGEDVSRGALSRWLYALLPENGKLERWIGDCQGTLRAMRVDNPPHVPETVLWDHAEAEFPGAVSIVSDNGDLPVRVPIESPGYRALDEGDVSALLVAEAQLAGPKKGSPRIPKGAPLSSLSGMRPKITLTAKNGNPDSGWLQGERGQLNTWIVKVEHSDECKGEAGIEAVCQNALALAGLPASQTLSRVIGGIQCVPSERSDREVLDGMVVPVHQEEYRQAAGMGIAKFRDLVKPRDEWPHAYRIAPESEHGALTKFLAAAWLLAHSDLHRGNLGFNVSKRGDGEKRVAVAPAYDVSSAVGTHLERRLEFPIAGQGDCSKIGVRHWAAHARACKVDVDQTLLAVAEVAEALPDAFADAIQAGKVNHENLEQAVVDRRSEATLKHVAARSRLFLEGMERRGACLGLERQ